MTDPADESAGKREVPGILRRAALIALLAGAVGSVGLLLRAGQRQATPRLLLLLIATWVIAPYLGLGWAFVASKRRAKPLRTATCTLMLVLPLAALPIYATDALRPVKAGAAALFVAVPAATWLLSIAVLVITAMAGRKR